MANAKVEIKKQVGVFDWFTPVGVITVPSFILRALTAVLIFPIPTLIAASAAAVIDKDSTNGTINLTVGLVAITSIVLGIWVLLATLTKHYRTKGVFAPFLFALLTPVLPFMLVLTWLFSSKERRTHYEHLAEQQAALRKMAKSKRKTKSMGGRTNAGYRRLAKDKASYRDDGAPTVRRRR
ncbi:hypothetical protein F9L33_08635 [Amylibacter sp. SFDW26]|uniref:hypothetical protein n=1 Tax=Amylibacter sp. SFDW26 TaxID=2652722 RepID=UPI001261B47C|nr:hypothetical protein [Amylibacter sp. SFDW26]KAB7614688.1 hypothetical protein F9L33_08635 [Amylibacter sp. SFDW26]